MNWDKDSIKLPHSYVLEVADEKFFMRVKQELPSILQFLQSDGEIKGYSLDNASMLGNKDGFILGRLAYKTDVYVPVDGLLDEYIDWLEEGENTNDSRK